MRKHISCTLAVFLLALASNVASFAARPVLVSKWDRFEREFKSDRSYENPLNDVLVTVVFTSPSGVSKSVNAFWDGGKIWKVRFSPNEIGRWVYTAVSTDGLNNGLQERSGTFTCTGATGKNRFTRHGPVRVSENGRYLEHDDGTPFFWLADTAWNGPLLAAPEEWAHYMDLRLRQGFSAVQWVTTQWRAAPTGNRFGQLAFTGRDRIQINPAFFQELDEKVDALNKVGLLNAPVLLWAIGGGSNPKINPGFDLPEDQAILLAKYMVARWGGNDVIWMLGGDGDYRGDKAEKWKRIGRAVFGNISHAPVVMHPGGMHWIFDEFAAEKWIGIHGYQSGHGDDDNTLKWLISGPPSKDWKKEPARPFINLEPPYENHIAYQSKKRITPEQVRRAVYWSLLVSPTAGVSYGGHGTWGWDDGSKPPTDHPSTGVPLSWDKALHMPGAKHMAHVEKLFTSIPFWELRPAPEILASQPGDQSPSRFIAASRIRNGTLTLIYTPAGGAIQLKPSALPKSYTAEWFNPRSGQKSPASSQNAVFKCPDNNDWVLIIRST